MRLAFFMGIRMSAKEQTQHLIASLYQEHIEIANIISDLHFDAELETKEVEHEMMRSKLRRSSLKATQNRLLLAGVTR